MDFGDKIKQIRMNQGLSQEQLAEKIGVSRQAVTKWETGKGLPDIENMIILAEIFKTTLDELVLQANPEYSPKQNIFSSETIYDIDCAKHFDIDLGSAREITVSTGKDEKLHIRLESETLENLGTLYKIKLDENKNRIDASCVQKDKISRFETEDAVSISVILPAEYSDHCEITASAKVLNISGLNIRRLEYDGPAEEVFISESSGSIELTSKTNYLITADRINGVLDINQWKARTVLNIPGENCPGIINKGRKCSVYCKKDGEIAEYEYNGDSEDKIIFNGSNSELIVEMR